MTTSLTQLSEHIQRGVDLAAGREARQRETDGRRFSHRAHRRRRFRLSRETGAAAGDADLCLVERTEDLAGVDAVKRHARGVRETRLRGAVNAGADKRRLEAVAQCADAIEVAKALAGETRGDAGADDRRDRLRAGAQSELLAAAVPERRQFQPAPDGEGADALRRVKLVAGD